MEYIKSAFSLIFAIITMYMLLDCDLKNKKNVFISCLIAAVFLLVDLFVIYHFGYRRFMALYPLIVQTPVFFMFLFLSRFSAVKVFFIHLTTIVITISFSMIALVLTSFWDYDRTLMNIICYIMYLPSGLLIYRYIRPSFLYMLRNTNKGWIGFCAIPLSYTAVTYYLSGYSLDNVISPRTLIYALALLVLTASAYALILRFFKQTREQYTIQNEHNIMQIQVNAAQTHFDALKDSQEKAALYRHDLHHHLNLINAFLTDNNQTEAQKYIAAINQSIEDSVVKQYCGNYAVNLILNYSLAKANYEGIIVETKIDLPQQNAVSDMDLCVVFSNAIENAVNACRRIPYTDTRKISLRCGVLNGKLVIQITNTCKEDVIFYNGLPVSVREDHGFGTRSIAVVAEKYGGLCSFTVENGEFNVNLIL